MGRRLGAPAAAAAVAVIALATVGILGHERVAGARAGVAAPADDASPEEVVRAFVADVNAHDDAAAKRLMTSDLVDAFSDGADDLDNVISMTDLVVTPPTTDGSGGPFTADSLTVHVLVSFTLRQREILSMDDGPTDWGYLLVRERVGAPWRIYDQGVV